MLEVGSRKMESSIEASFYPDESSTYLLKERMRNVRKTLTLDLDSPGGGSAKRQKFSLLSSPDLNMLKLGSPELENLIIQQQNGHVTTTPTPTQFIFARTVTEEQAMYAEGFVNALRELHSSQQIPANGVGQEQQQQQQQQQQLLDGDQHQQHHQLNADPSPHQSGTTTVYVTTSSANSPGTYTSSSSPANTTSSGHQHLSTVPPYQAPTSCAYGFSSFGDPAVVGNGPPRIKEEPQTVPPSACSSPPLSPIDMMAQERIKLERKRQRNRVAASKCRKRKLERIARLEHKVSLLKNENTDLGTVVTKLKDHICGLKQQLMEHVNSGCHILTPSQY